MKNSNTIAGVGITPILKVLIFIVVFQGLLIQAVAQDTERKDKCDLITIYVRLDYLDSVRLCCPEDLQMALDSIDGVNDLRINPFKQLVIFNMSSNKLIEEDQLKKRVRQAGFIPLKVLYSKEPLEEVDGDVMF